MQIQVSSKINNRMTNSVDPDKTARNESHLDLHCLERYLCWSVGMKGLNQKHNTDMKIDVSAIVTAKALVFC